MDVNHIITFLEVLLTYGKAPGGSTLPDPEEADLCALGRVMSEAPAIPERENSLPSYKKNTFRDLKKNV